MEAVIQRWRPYLYQNERDNRNLVYNGEVDMPSPSLVHTSNSVSPLMHTFSNHLIRLSEQNY